MLGIYQLTSCLASLCVTTLCSLIGLWYSCGGDFHLGGFLFNMNMISVITGWYNYCGCIYTVQARLGAFFYIWWGLMRYESWGVDGGRGYIDPSLPQLCRGKTRHGGGSSSRSPPFISRWI